MAIDKWRSDASNGHLSAALSCALPNAHVIPTPNSLYKPWWLAAHGSHCANPACREARNQRVDLVVQNLGGERATDDWCERDAAVGDRFVIAGYIARPSDQR